MTDEVSVTNKKIHYPVRVILPTSDVEFDFDYSSTIRKGEWFPFPDKGRLMVTMVSIWICLRFGYR